MEGLTNGQFSEALWAESKRSKKENDLIFAAKNVLWKLNHNHDLPDYKGPARIDRKDATVRMLQSSIDAYENN